MQNHYYRQQNGQQAADRPGMQGGPYSAGGWQDGLTGTATVRQPDGGPGGNVIHDTYVIQGVIGSGSGGIVYKAWHRRLQKSVVLKKMKVSRSSIAENRRETDILKRLRHSYLPGVIDFIDVNGEVFTVMDYIEGQSLAEVIKSGWRINQEQAVT